MLQQPEKEGIYDGRDQKRAAGGEKQHFRGQKWSKSGPRSQFPDTPKFVVEPPLGWGGPPGDCSP